MMLATAIVNRMLACLAESYGSLGLSLRLRQSYPRADCLETAICFSLDCTLIFTEHYSSSYPVSAASPPSATTLSSILVTAVRVLRSQYETNACQQTVQCRPCTAVFRTPSQDDPTVLEWRLFALACHCFVRLVISLRRHNLCLTLLTTTSHVKQVSKENDKWESYTTEFSLENM